MDEINIGNMSFIMLVSIVFPALFLPVQPQDKCAVQDPCNPTVPCDPGSTLVYPVETQDPCNIYQKCIAPYEWNHRVLCPGNIERYDDTSCDCVEFGACTIPSPPCLPPSDATPIKGNVSEPCFYDNNDRECTGEKEGTTVPDRYYCTRYYKCVAGEWGQMVCPPGGDVGYPYYDVGSSTSPNPCSQYSAVCDLIGFDRCLDPPPPTTTTTTVTTQALYTGETTVPPHCAPEHPCTQEDTLSNPADCYSYQQCVAPFEWVISNVNCGGDKGPYDPNFKLCRPQAPCLNLTCTVFNDTTLPASDQSPCSPTVPCDVGTTLPRPTLDTSTKEYQECIAPYEWDHQKLCTGGSDSYYDEGSCQCMFNGDCSARICDPPVGSPTPGNKSEPCFYDNNNRECNDTNDGMTVPDRYYCTRYYRCSDKQWIKNICPVESPYYDTNSAGTPIPCSPTSVPCKLIFFNQCLDPPIEFDPCHPTVPCKQSEKITYPQNCQMYQQCIGPYEWTALSCPPGETFSNVTGQCHVDNVCQQWPCSNDTSTKKPSEPCIIDNQQCVEGKTIPDMYYCTSYYKCVDGDWIFLSCPVQEPYFSISMSNLGEPIPCTTTVSSCDQIPYDQCAMSTVTASGHTHTGLVEAQSELSEPCLPEEEYQCLEGRVVPDRYQCTGYYTCYRAAWTRKKCPEATPYYDGDLLLTGGYNRGIPCTDDVTKCVTESGPSCATAKHGI